MNEFSLSCAPRADIPFTTIVRSVWVDPNTVCTLAVTSSGDLVFVDEEPGSGVGVCGDVIAEDRLSSAFSQFVDANFSAISHRLACLRDWKVSMDGHFWRSIALPMRISLTVVPVITKEQAISSPHGFTMRLSMATATMMRYASQLLDQSACILADTTTQYRVCRDNLRLQFDTSIQGLDQMSQKISSSSPSTDLQLCVYKLEITNLRDELNILQSLQASRLAETTADIDRILEHLHQLR